MNDHKRTDFNVNDILGKNESKLNNRSAAQNILLNRIKSKIEFYNHHNKDAIIFDIPPFTIGVPPYNINEMIQFIIEYLQNAGFFVLLVPKRPFSIYICWNPNKIQQLQKEKNGYLTLQLNGNGFFDNIPINPNAVKNL